MCGIAGIAGRSWRLEQLQAMVAVQQHRGPDAEGVFACPSRSAGLGHNRLSIIDLTSAGRQPMFNRDGTVAVCLNGEIYNYVELRRELCNYPYRSETDTEVILAAYEQWGEKCLDKLLGMFAFIVWDAREQRLFAARDRFGVKPLYYAFGAQGELLLASEIKALHAAGLAREPDETAWSTYLASGVCDHNQRTFWRGVSALPAGHCLTWYHGETRIRSWYDIADRIGGDCDERPIDIVQEEYTQLLADSVRLRFRADVPVGVNLSGGLDSATLLGLIQAVQGTDSEVKAFTYVTGDPRYDELPWVEQMLARTRHPSLVATLRPQDVPELAKSVQAHQDEPFGGLPTLAYAKVFELARADGVIVLLDGQGMDEQWAGYDYYTSALNGHAHGGAARTLQGTRQRAVRPECLLPEFLARSEPLDRPQPFPDALRNLQYRDARHTKIPRALRFNDRVSMRVGTELREPFLDHRLFELAMRQPPQRKIVGGTQKWMLRRLARQVVPANVVEAPKRPVQTCQREWLREALRPWADDMIERGLNGWGSQWLDAEAVRREWRAYQRGESDNSYYIWQWVNLGLAT